VEVESEILRGGIIGGRNRTGGSVEELVGGIDTNRSNGRIGGRMGGRNRREDWWRIGGRIDRRKSWLCYSVCCWLCYSVRDSSCCSVIKLTVKTVRTVRNVTVFKRASRQRIVADGWRSRVFYFSGPFFRIGDTTTVQLYNCTFVQVQLYKYNHYNCTIVQLYKYNCKSTTMRDFYLSWML
jgi:hypothetical protein